MIAYSFAPNVKTLDSSTIKASILDVFCVISIIGTATSYIEAPPCTSTFARRLPLNLS